MNLETTDSQNAARKYMIHPKSGACSQDPGKGIPWGGRGSWPGDRRRTKPLTQFREKDQWQLTWLKEPSWGAEGEFEKTGGERRPVHHGVDEQEGEQNQRQTLMAGRWTGWGWYWSTLIWSCQSPAERDVTPGERTIDREIQRNRWRLRALCGSYQLDPTAQGLS